MRYILRMYKPESRIGYIQGIVLGIKNEQIILPILLKKANKLFKRPSSYIRTTKPILESQHNGNKQQELNHAHRSSRADFTGSGLHR